MFCNIVFYIVYFIHSSWHLCLPSCYLTPTPFTLHSSNHWFLVCICRFAATAAKSLQSCSTLCAPMDGSLSSSPIPEILQARTLEWVAISFSHAWKWKVKVKSLSRACPTLSNPIDCSQAVSVHGIFQARVLEWGAIAFSKVHEKRQRGILHNDQRTNRGRRYNIAKYICTHHSTANVRQVLTCMKEEINSNTVIVGDFNTPLTPMDRSAKQKINKETQTLTDTMGQLDLIDIYGAFHSKTMNFTFFSVGHETFARIDHILGQKSSLGKFKNFEIIASLFSDHSVLRLDVNYRKKKKLLKIQTYGA